MKNILKLFLAAAAVIVLYTACNKVDSLPTYANGNAVALSISAATVTPAPADSNKVAVTFSWTNPNYSQNSSLYKYIIQIDSTGRNFSKAYAITVTGALTTSMLAKEINAVALSFGFAFNTAYDMDIRVISSYGNNNERYTSPTVKLRYTPYKIPPKIALPTTGRLFLVGDATQGSWNNPVPVPTQEFSQLDETTWAGVFNLNGNKQYLVLPLNGDWGHKFAIADGSVPATGGDFGYDLSTNFNGPASGGWYTITLSFQTGKFSVTPFTGVLPNNLFIVGDATAGAWNNPVPTPSQQLVRLNSSQFELSLPLVGGKQYLLLPVNGDWSHKYAVADNSIPGLSAGGDFGYDFGQNFPGPATSGTYKVSVNFAVKGSAAGTSKFTVK